VKFLKMALQVE